MHFGSEVLATSEPNSREPRQKPQQRIIKLNRNSFDDTISESHRNLFACSFGIECKYSMVKVSFELRLLSFAENALVNRTHYSGKAWGKSPIRIMNFISNISIEILLWIVFFVVFCFFAFYFPQKKTSHIECICIRITYAYPVQQMFYNAMVWIGLLQPLKIGDKFSWQRTRNYIKNRVNIHYSMFTLFLQHLFFFSCSPCSLHLSSAVGILHSRAAAIN